MSERKLGEGENLDEIENHAAIAAIFYLEQGNQAANNELTDKGRAPASIAGFQIAAAIQYQAERQVDAAHRIADALQNVADAINQQKAKGARDE